MYERLCIVCHGADGVGANANIADKHPLLPGVQPLGRAGGRILRPVHLRDDPRRPRPHARLRQPDHALRPLAHRELRAQLQRNAGTFQAQAAGRGRRTDECLHHHIPSDDSRALPARATSDDERGRRRALFVVGLIAVRRDASGQDSLSSVDLLRRRNWLFFSSISIGQRHVRRRDLDREGEVELVGAPGQPGGRARSCRSPSCSCCRCSPSGRSTSRGSRMMEYDADRPEEGRVPEHPLPAVRGTLSGWRSYSSAIAMYFVYLAVRPDMGLTEGAEEGDAKGRRGVQRLTQGWLGQEQEEVRLAYQRMTGRIAPAIVLSTPWS